MTVFMPCKRRFLIWLVLAFRTASNAMASTACRNRKASRPVSGSKPIPSDTFTWTSAMSEPSKASSNSLWRLTEPLSLSVSNCSKARLREDAGAFLRRLIKTVPYRIHTNLTDNGSQFAKQVDDEGEEQAGIFDTIRETQGIDHRLTKVSITRGRMGKLNGCIGH